VDLVKGQAQVLPKSGKSFDPALIPKAIKDAGFSVPEVAATVDGTLVSRKESLELDVPGLKHPFILAGGSQAQTLEKRVDLVGKRVRVTSKLHPSHADLPPGLTVENFQPSPK
jgi:hypothetical protein